MNKNQLSSIATAQEKNLNYAIFKEPGGLTGAASFQSVQPFPFGKAGLRNHFLQGLRREMLLLRDYRHQPKLPFYHPDKLLMTAGLTLEFEPRALQYPFYSPAVETP